MENFDRECCQDKMKKPSKSRIINVIVTVLLGSGFIFGFYCTLWFQQSTHHFEQYRQSITVFLGAILAAMMTVTIFYMGKFHDYQREFIKQESNLDRIMNKSTMSLDECSMALSYLKSEIKLTIDSKLVERGSQLIEKLQNTIVDLKASFTDAEKSSQELREIRTRLAKYPRYTILSLIVDLYPFAFGFVYLTINTEPTLGRLYNLIIILVIGIGAFVHSWYIREWEMDLFHRYYKTISGMITRYQHIKDGNEMAISSIEKATTQVFHKLSKNK